MFYYLNLVCPILILNMQVFHKIEILIFKLNKLSTDHQNCTGVEMEKNYIRLFGNNAFLSMDQNNLNNHGRAS